MSCGDHALSCHSRIRTHILEESCACPSLPRSVAPSSYACDGTGTAVTALVNLHARNERTGTHGTGCACRCFHELAALRRFAERQRVRRAIRRVTCRKTRSSEPSPVFLNTTLSRERPQTLATRPARQAPIRCPGARTRLRALYVNPSFPIYKTHEPRHRALFSPKSWGKHEPRPADRFIKSP